MGSVITEASFVTNLDEAYRFYLNSDYHVENRKLPLVVDSLKVELSGELWSGGFDETVEI